MKIVNSLQPNFNAILANGMNPDPMRTVFTYNDTIYNPSGNPIPMHLQKHEEVHMRQQNGDPDNWWGRYFVDSYFRIDQEAEAYAAQYDNICIFERDRNKRVRILHELAGFLSGKGYGGIIGKIDAMKIIISKAKTK